MGDNRVVVLVDMDCFYCQVEVRLNPAHTGKPLAVVQYNAWRGGGIIAVNYEARDKGVKRGMRGDEAKKLCPDIVLCKVAEVRGKADLTKYRDAGREVVEVLHEFSSCIQVASIDESYLDITEAVEERLLQNAENGISSEKLKSTFVIGYSDDKSNDEDKRTAGLEQWLENLSDPSCLRLAAGAMIVEEMRAAVFQRTTFRCSAGISYNKPLAKLVCAVHKPNRQTVLPPDKVEIFFSTLPLRKMRNLGGKFGMEVIERLGCQTMGDLAKFSLRELQKHYDDKNGLWLFNIAHGIDHEPVTVRLIPKSIGCSKNFPGRTALGTRKNVEHWLSELISELVVRLTEDQANNKRRAQHLTISVSQDTDDGSLAAVTRSGPLPCYNVDRIVALALQLISKTNTAPISSLSWEPPIKNISISAGKFTADCSSQKTSIQSFFKQVSKEYSQSQAALEVKGRVEGKVVPHIQRTEQIVLRNSESAAPEKKIKRSSLDNYFKQSNVLFDDDSSRDMFLDDTNAANDSYGIPEQQILAGDDSDINHIPAPNKSKIFSQLSASRRNSSDAANKSHSSDKSVSKKRKNRSPTPDRSEHVVCPENLESVVAHSFFARYILSKKVGSKPNSIIIAEPKPSTSREIGGPSSMNVSKEPDVDTFENSNSNDSDLFEKCGECGKLVALQEFPEHFDYHSAVRLQQELNENPTPPDYNAPGPSTANGLKQNTSRHSNDSSSRDSEVPPLENEPNLQPPMERCSYCSKLIPLEEFPEHIDYHSALNLQRELNKPVSAPAVASNAPSALGKKKKAQPKRQGPSPIKKVQSNSITSFFGPK